MCVCVCMFFIQIHTSTLGNQICYSDGRSIATSIYYTKIKNIKYTCNLGKMCKDIFKLTFTKFSQ